VIGGYGSSENHQLPRILRYADATLRSDSFGRRELEWQGAHSFGSSCPQLSMLVPTNSTLSLGRVKEKLSGASLDPEDLWMWMEEQVAPFESQLLY